MTKHRPASSFDRLVFSGGGTRCFWQLGFLDAAAGPLGLARHAVGPEATGPSVIAAVSSGVLSACAWRSGRADALLSTMSELFAAQRHNVGSPHGEDGTEATPHQDLYRDTVKAVFDEEAVAAIAEGPPLLVNLTVPPPLRPRLLSVAAALVAYELDHKIRSSPHTRYPRLIGAKPLQVDAAQAARDGRLHALICAAATIPPVFDLKIWDGWPVMDGGMTENAPLPAGPGSALILLTRRYRRLPAEDGAVYAAPSHEVPADKADFTDPGELRRTWDLGRRDGVRFLESPARREPRLSAGDAASWAAEDRSDASDRSP